MFHLLKNNLVNESPVTMMNMSEAGRNQFGVSEPPARTGLFGETADNGADIDFFQPNIANTVTETSVDKTMEAVELKGGHGARKSKPPMPKTGFAGTQPQKAPSEGYFNAAGDTQLQDKIVVEEFGMGSVAPFTP